MLETRFRGKDIYSSLSWSAPKLFRRPEEAFRTTTVVVPPLLSLSLRFNLSASFHFMLPFFHTQLLQRRQRRNLLKIIRCPLLGFDINFLQFSRRSCPTAGELLLPRISVFGFRFRPPQVSMDTKFVLYYKTYCCSPTSTALCLFFNLREAVQLKSLVTPTRSDHHHRNFAVANNVSK